MDAENKLMALVSVLCVFVLSGVAAAQETTRTSPRGGDPASGGDIRYVQVSRASIYAGPSDDYYPTSQLNRGDAVEVFQRTGDGWLAIRPPKGSFSWLPASQGLLLPGGRVVEVTDKSSVSWIGTSLGTAKQYRWQVRLNPGEQLAVLGEQTMGAGESESKTLWYKISPPNGEYRWIQEQATTLDAPAAETALVSAEGEVISDAADNPASVESIGQSVPTSSFEGAVNGGDSQRPRGVLPASADVPSSADRWSNWHAIEFSNGSFSFPGIARMFGIEPAPAARSNQTYDPFDLAAEPTRTRHKLTADSPDQSVLRDGSDDSAASSASETQLASHKLHGWRDPRELRDARQRGSIGQEPAASQGSDLHVVSADGNAGSRLSEMIAGGSGSEVGTGVTTAGATTATGSTTGQSNVASGDDAGWYGIQQAPQAADYKPLALSQADLGEVQLRLSEMVARPEHTWDLAPLADRTRYLIEHGVTAIERGEARLLLDRIEAFADLARRSTELGLTPNAAATALSSLGPTAASVENSSPIAQIAARWSSPLGIGAQAGQSASGSGLRFDATGWIVPVHSSGRDMPTHALTNDTGKIIVYLSPAAGVNLVRYQGQPVGVYGLRGYLPQLKSNHIQVQRAVRLQ